MVSRVKKTPVISGIVVFLVVAAIGYFGNHLYQEHVAKVETLKKIISRLQADSRIAEVLVTKVEDDPVAQHQMTTIKFLEYDSQGHPLTPRYFTFNGNIIQFQSLVVRFDDVFVSQGDALRGRSAYLFWKVFVLDGKNTQEYPLSQINEIPAGYKLEGAPNLFEDKIWQEFWTYALDSKRAISKGIKNAQIEAPGTRFLPGILYTIRIEHDGGIRIDSQEIPAILKGETIGR